MAERGTEAGGEQLDALRLVQTARPREQGLEPILVLLHGTSPMTSRHLAEWIGSERSSKAQVEELLEVAP